MLSFIGTVALASIFQTEIDPQRLKIGTPGEITIKTGDWVDTKSGKRSNLSEFVKQARSHNFVFVGESHDHVVHHQTQADVIEALVKDGREVIVGFEMFTRPNQINLAPFTMGRWSDEKFIEEAQWKTQWGFPYPIYKPIFDQVKANRLPMLALNVPRDWVRTVNRQGLENLQPENKAQIPAVDVSNKDHRSIFTAMVGGHSMPGVNMDNMYAAQCVWDTGMADSAIKYLVGRFGSMSNVPKRIAVVIIAGSGHGSYEQGINWRIKQNTGFETLTLICTEAEKEATVSRGLGDFVFVAPPQPRKAQ